jgi:type I restriction enzyme S subunit
VTPLQALVEVNPSTPAFDRLSGDAFVSFLPLEAVWPGSRLDTSRIARKSQVDVGYTRFQNGDILVPKITPTFEAGRSTIVHGLSGGVAAGTTEVHVLRVRPGTDARFVMYLTQSEPFLTEGHASMTGVAGQKRVSADWVRRFGVAITGADTQRSVADDLDREVAAIDSLIEQKRRLGARLQEWVLAQAYAALSQGLARTTLRPTGLPWLPTVPAHWTLEPLRARYSVQLGKMLNPNASGGANLAPYLRNVNVQWDHVDVSDLNEMAFDDDERTRLGLKHNDLLVCEGGEVGRTAVWRGELGTCYFQKAVHRLRRRGQADVPRHLYYVMRVAASVGAFRAGGNRSTIVHLTKEKLQAHRFPFPSAAEQAEIVQVLDRATADAGRLQELLGQQIDKLHERRAALSTAAVAGRLDMRSVA